MLNKHTRMLSHAAVLSAATLITSSFGISANAQGTYQRPKSLHAAARPAVTNPVARPQPCVANHLVITVDPKADKQEVADALKEVNGTVEKTIKIADTQFLYVRTEAGKMDEVQKKLSTDRKHFGHVAQDAIYTTQGIVGLDPDPDFYLQGNLVALNVPQAWEKSTGQGVYIGFPDSGCQSTNPDLAGHTATGLNLLRSNPSAAPGGAVDFLANDGAGYVPHGTLVSTVALASRNNFATAGVAYGATAVPYQVMGPDHNIDLFNVLLAIADACNHNVKIMNYSFGGSDSYSSVFNPNNGASALIQIATYLHHYRYGGLDFFSIGNYGRQDTNARIPWMYGVSGFSLVSGELARYSAYGAPVWFTAPSDPIYTSDNQNRLNVVAGTSFSSPEVAAIAALVWSKNPDISNDQVIGKIVQTCLPPSDRQSALQYGFGLPDAQAAVN